MTTLRHDEGRDMSSRKRNSANWSNVSCETHWRVNFKDWGGTPPPAKQNAVNTCSSHCALWTLENLRKICLWKVCCNNWQEPSPLCWISGQPAQAISCINSWFKSFRCDTLKSNVAVGLGSWNFDGLLKLLSLLLNNTVAFFLFALLILLYQWREKPACDVFFFLLSWNSKQASPFLWLQQVINQVTERLSITMYISVQQIMESIYYFWSYVSSHASSIALIWASRWQTTSFIDLGCNQIRYWWRWLGNIVIAVICLSRSIIKDWHRTIINFIVF